MPDVLADKDHASNRSVEGVTATGRKLFHPYRAGSRLAAMIPSLHEERSLIERMYTKLKRFRRIAARYEKLAATCLGFVFVAATWLWLK